VRSADASIVDDKVLVDGTKAALDKLQARKRAAENRIDQQGESRRLMVNAVNLKLIG
jgi:hypothetical protein